MKTGSIRYATVCSGVEAMSLAVSGMDWKPVFFSEIEPFPCKLLKHRFPNVPNLGDMTKIKGEDYYGAIDVLAGGTPCQSFSIAGKRGGLGDKRGNLMLKFAELAYTTGAKWVVWENVPGVLSSGNGADFGCLLSSLAGWDVPTPAEGWRNSGIVRERAGHFGLAWRILDAQYTRVDGFPRAIPQRRRRVWVVGHIGGWTHSAQVLLESHGLLGNTPPSRKTGQGTSAGVAFGPGGAKPTDVASTLDCKCKDGPIRNQEGIGICDLCINDSRITESGNMAPTITSRAGTGGGNLPLVTGTFIKERHDKFVQGESASTLRAHDGKEFSDLVVLNDQGGSKIDISKNVTGTLRAQSKGHEPLVMGFHPKPSAKASGLGCAEELAPTLGTCDDHAVLCKTYSIQGAATRENVKSGPDGAGIKEGVAYTLEARSEVQMVAEVKMIRMRSGCEGAEKGALIGDNLSHTLATANDQTLVDRMAVRRLTPTECERLMGFPDGWTNIQNGTKPTPDSVRYKACGNSWARNEAEWVMGRIDRHERNA